jgi:hypothetical protein
VKRFYQLLSLATVFVLSLNAKAQNTDSMMISRMDSVEISLLTCSPHEAIYSLYGHTAIRINDQRNGEDLAVNYGLFSFEKPHFVLRFLFGLTDYEMGIEPFEAFCRQYRYYGSSVTQQVLNLTNEEKWNIVKAVNINYMPENSVYRYNYFYDNCTTRAVDMLTTHLADAHVVFEGEQQKYPSFREMVHGCLPHHPWNRFGNDMLLGVKADCKTTLREHQFLPANAMDDFRHAMIVGQDGSNRPLVLREEIVVPEGAQDVWKDFPLSPKDVFLIVLAITVLITLLEAYTKKVLWGYDALLMILCGLAGIVLFLMLFSQHPTVRVNLLLLLLNPLPLFFIWRMIRRARKRLPDRQYAGWIILICLFFIGGIWQHYAEGIFLLASSLLIRNVWCLLRQRKYTTRPSVSE